MTLLTYTVDRILGFITRRNLCLLPTLRIIPWELHGDELRIWTTQTDGHLLKPVQLCNEDLFKSGRTFWLRVDLVMGSSETKVRTLGRMHLQLREVTSDSRWPRNGLYGNQGSLMSSEKSEPPWCKPYPNYIRIIDPGVG